MDIKNLKTAKQLLEKEFGNDGTEKRKAFQKEAYSYYLSEILKSRRLELKLSQEELAQKVGKKKTTFQELRMAKMLEFQISCK